jgi:DNA-directed RNA polymerase subunit beta
MQVRPVKDYSKRGDAQAIPNLVAVQTDSYKRFLQSDLPAEKRQKSGLEGLLHEAFPLSSFDGKMKLEYISYELEEPRYTPDECRALRLTYGMPLKVKLRLQRQDKPEIMEEGIYLGDIPIMMGGGEFIINGAERVIVSQLHRSPGVDFMIGERDGDRPLHATRVIPERGSWIEINVTKKDLLAVRIDQSSKIPATTFLRAMDEKYSTDEAILRAFYEVETISAGQLKPEYYAAGAIVDTATGEELVKAGAQIGDAVAKIQASAIKKVDVIKKMNDAIILNTLQEDGTHSYKESLEKIYSRLRPGNPVNFEKSKALFHEKFFDDNRYRLGRVGRFRINRKFDLNVSEDLMTLRAEDIIQSIKYLMGLRANQGYVDDIDHLGNRRLRTIDELAAEEMRKGFLKLKRTVQERMSNKDETSAFKIVELVNSKSISSAIEFFFGRSELSQVVDQTNPLAQLTHERRLSALGPGGLNRKRAGFEVRDVHISHYGRICPIETPEGTNIGLIASMSIYASLDEYGFLITPYRRVVGGKVEDKTVNLRADEEMKAVFAPPEVLEPGTNKIKPGTLLARVRGDLQAVDSKDVNYVDISPKQVVSLSAALIPFLEHDDANRALMGSNMQRQAVPLLKCDPPFVGTGIEKNIPQHSGMVVKAEFAGVVTYCDATRIVIKGEEETQVSDLRKNAGLNDKTCLTQKPLVKLGQKVKKNQIIADGPACKNGELALGKNVLVAFMTFDGYNFEDAIVLNERLLKEDTFTSIHIEEFEVEIRETKLGREEFTRDIPNVSEKALKNLDDMGVVRIGTRVGPGDILVGKVSPKSKTELSPEEKLLHAIFGRAGEDVKNDSLDVPAGTEGVVIAAQKFSRRMHLEDDQKKELDTARKAYAEEMDKRRCAEFRKIAEEINALTGADMMDPKTRQKVGKSLNDEVILEQIENFNPDWIKAAEKLKTEAEKIYTRFRKSDEKLVKEKQRKLEHMKRGDELPSGVLEMVKVYLATKRHLSVGDKMAGRHGNKGVIARIVPEEDMPFMPDGTPVDILLNPLGVPSRMNVGQILETHLGWAASILGYQAVTPVFDGAEEREIYEAVEAANQHVRERTKLLADKQQVPPAEEIFVEMPKGLKMTLHDGRTGEAFEQKVTVGYMYMLKLHHLVDEKIHARSTGPYSLITQQPLGGKARTGGQRFGEMEVWALEAYGAGYILQELLTVKSDDVEGRTKIYESMVKGTNILEAGTPVSFDVLCNEIRGLGLNIVLEKKKSL